MTEQEHARAIRAAATSLNSAIEAAAAEGIKTEIELRDYDISLIAHPTTTLVAVTVTKEIR